jgi:Zn-dependent peptidase ImmA (M78 family)
MKAFKFTTGFKSDSEKISLDYRKDLGLKFHDPLPASLLSKHLRIKVLSPHDVFGNDSPMIEVLLSSKEWSALTMTAKSGERLIILHNAHSVARQESDIMHELAHVICKHETGEKARINGAEILLRKYDERQEREAEWLGGCLQIPREALVWHLARNYDIKRIASVFSASQQMVQFRMNYTGVKRQLSHWH